MQAGQLRHRIELQSCDGSKNTFGEKEKIWTTYATVWASIEPLRGRELLWAQQISAELTHSILIRYNSDVTVKDRAKMGVRIFTFNVVKNMDEKDEMLEILCKEVA